MALEDHRTRVTDAGVPPARVFHKKVSFTSGAGAMKSSCYELPPGGIVEDVMATRTLKPKRTEWTRSRLDPAKYARPEQAR